MYVAMGEGHDRDSDEYGALERIQRRFTTGCWRPDVDLFDDVDGRLSHVPDERRPGTHGAAHAARQATFGSDIFDRHLRGCRLNVRNLL